MHIKSESCLTLDSKLDLEELELEERLLERRDERLLDALLEELLSLFDTLLTGAVMSTILLLRREEELDDAEEETLERELL